MRILVDLICTSCDTKRIDALVARGEFPPCPDCGDPMTRLWMGKAPSVRPDSIPGGLTIEHGLCNPDGTPRTYYSQSEITLECQKRGLTRWTDIHTEDKTKDARVRMDWYQSSEAKKAKAQRDEARKEKALARDRAQAQMR